MCLTLVWVAVGKSSGPDKNRVVIKHNGGSVLCVKLEQYFVLRIS